MKNKIWRFVVGLLSVGALAYAVGLSGLIINEPGATYNKRYTFNLENADVNTLTATAVYSSVTYSAATFTTGQVSTGSFLVVSNALISSAAATNAITVASVLGAVGDSIVVSQLNKPGAYVFLAGRDWNYKATTALTAASIKTALNKVPYFLTSQGGSTLFSTSTTLGSNANAILVQTNNPVTITVSSPTFLGGRDAATVSVNGYVFKPGRDYVLGASAAATATAIKNAINAKAGLSTYVTAATATSSVTLQSPHPGTIYNLPLVSSNSSALRIFHNPMQGGANESWALNSGAITVPNHGFPLGLAVLYSTGPLQVVIGGLTPQTTYYVVPIDANTIGLSSTSAVAQTGVYKLLTTSSTLTASDTFTLTPVAWTAGSAGFQWEVSNDGSSWTRVATSSVTYSNTASGSMSWALTPTQLNYKYLSLNLVGPTFGGLRVQVNANGTYIYQP